MYVRSVVDGKWIYLTSKAGGAFHTWRQRFPDGQPEQVTTGPTEEEGIAVAPDGRSFITAVALKQSSVWVHDAGGERQISLEATLSNRASPQTERGCTIGFSKVVRLAALRVSATQPSCGWRIWKPGGVSRCCQAFRYSEGWPTISPGTAGKW